MRRDQSGPHHGLAGSLLLAHPRLRDPHFRRAVVLVSAHDDEGAMGVVLNRPTGQTLGQLGEVFAGGPLADVPVFAGGPVMGKQVIICGWRFAGEDQTFRLHFGLLPEKAEEFLAEKGAHVRAFLGHSGWSAGQLEDELRQDTWVVSAIPATFMALPQEEGLWRAILGELNHEWKLLAEEPEDPSVN